MENIKYDPNPAPFDDSDVKRYVYDEFQRIAIALQITPRWDDLRFPAQAINPPGGVQDPGFENSTGLLLFDPAKTERVAGVAQLPHSWKEESIIKPHIHWQKTTSATGTVLWQIDYEVINNGDVATMTYPNSLSSSTPVAGTPDNDTANECLITSLGDIDMTGAKASSLLFWYVSRVGGSDTYGSDARLVEFDIHYEIDSLGSESEFVKR